MVVVTVNVFGARYFTIYLQWYILSNWVDLFSVCVVCQIYSVLKCDVILLEQGQFS